MSEPSAQGPDREDEATGPASRADQASQRLIGVVEKLVERLDVAAAFVLDTLVGDLLEPIRRARRVLWIVAALFLSLGVFALAAPARFMEAAPYIFGGLFILTALGMVAIEKAAAKAEAQVQRLTEKARTWKKVGSWAKEILKLKDL